MRSGHWKLHLAKANAPREELYDLSRDPGETTNLYTSHPDVVVRLQASVQQGRIALGDARLGVVGRDTRPIGEVANPVGLTEYDPSHPYYVAEYDLADRG